MGLLSNKAMWHGIPSVSVVALHLRILITEVCNGQKLRIPQSPNLYADHVETLIDDATPKKRGSEDAGKMLERCWEDAGKM